VLATLLLAACESTPVEVASPAAAIVVHAVLNPDVAEQVVLVCLAGDQQLEEHPVLVT
jgi:hypothetical protein